MPCEGLSSCLVKFDGRLLSSIQFFLYEFIKQVLEVAPSDLRLFFDVLSGLELSQGG